MTASVNAGHPRLNFSARRQYPSRSPSLFSNQTSSPKTALYSRDRGPIEPAGPQGMYSEMPQGKTGLYSEESLQALATSLATTRANTLRTDGCSPWATQEGMGWPLLVPEFRLSSPLVLTATAQTGRGSWLCARVSVLK
jgi:hypothetical protein